MKTALFSRQRAAISWQKDLGDGFPLLPACPELVAGLPVANCQLCKTFKLCSIRR